MDKNTSTTSNKDNVTTKLTVVSSVQMEMQTASEDTLARSESSFTDDSDVSNESIKDECDLSNSEEVVAVSGRVEKESTKENKRQLYMGRFANECVSNSIAKLEREIRKLRLENKKLKLINMKEMESLNKRDKAITKPSGNLHDADDKASPDILAMKSKSIC